MANINPNDVFKLLKNKNPQQVAMQLLQNSNDPTAKQLLNLIKQGDNAGIQQFAENFFRQRGSSLESELARFMDVMGKI